MNEITLNAYAKVNLFLEVTGKRADGFHSLATFFQSVSLCDVLTMKKCGAGIVLDGTDRTLDYGESNLVFRAIRLFYGETGICGGVKAFLNKRIPMQAGLGGGSADAAAALRGMNLLYGSPLPEEKLLSLCERLGSDVPFCYLGGSYYGEGRGELLTPSPSLPHCFLVIAVGEEEKMPTGTAFARLDSLGYLPLSPEGMAEALRSGELRRIAGAMFNRFSSGRTGKEETMLACGALGTLLCGSGAAVFGIFADREHADMARDRLLALGARACTAEPV